MKKIIPAVITAAVVIGLIAIGLLNGINLTELQKETFLILIIMCASAALYCFAVGEITRNNSQMDKLWSLMPIAYLWVIAIKGGMSPRLIVMAALVTVWGVRLTYNFGRKGAYSIRFWAGKEDYRWSVLRQNKFLKTPVGWALFDLLFISIFQNAIVLAICLPALAVMSSSANFGAMDYVASALTLFFIVYEAIADNEQYAFQTKKHQLLSEGKELKDLPSPYNLGFCASGLFRVSRHPNYLGEQGTWIAFYLFVIGAGATHYYVFNWSIVGCMMLVILFLGSSSLGESISSSKYPQYRLYQSEVSKYLPLPWKKYRG